MHDPRILDYIDAMSNTDDPVLIEIERSTHLHTLAPQMLSGRVQGALLTMLAKLIDAKLILEIGTFTGFGAICLARGLSKEPGSKVVTYEANPELGFLIRKHIDLAVLSDKIETVTGNVLELLPDRQEMWDMVYIDANKQEYPAYYDAVIDRVRPGGLIISDNVLWSGKVVFEPDDVDASIIRGYNVKLRDDPRVEVVVLSVRDGLSVARKLA
jgi:caffeoyl-CoA O-methyltransferase